MTPLLRSVIKSVADSGQDPTELNWFDATGCLEDKTEQSQDPLLTMRPPFERCIVCWEGSSTNHQRMEMHMVTVGTDPEEGISLALWRAVYGQQPVPSPLLFYVVEDGVVVRYGTYEEDTTIDEREARMILGFVSAWLSSLSRRAEALVPVAKPTFTNRRKIAEGKMPSYDWHTVVIEPAQVRREHQGGTHASPRLHDRRGHLRRLRSGKNVWVKACKVGDASKGAVFHDYEVK